MFVLSVRLLSFSQSQQHLVNYNHLSVLAPGTASLQVCNFLLNPSTKKKEETSGFSPSKTSETRNDNTMKNKMKRTPFISGFLHPPKKSRTTCQESVLHHQPILTSLTKTPVLPFQLCAEPSHSLADCGCADYAIVLT